MFVALVKFVIIQPCYPQENGDGDVVDFRSYCIDIEGGNKHTVSFVKKV